MEWNKKTLRNIFLGVAGCIVLYWLLHETTQVFSWVQRFINLISPFLVGAAIAFILNVPMRGFERMLKFIKSNGWRRGLSILLTLIAVLLVIAGVVYLIIPQIASAVETLIEEIPGFVNRVITSITTFINSHPELLAWVSENTDFHNMDWSEVAQKAISFVTGSLGSVADSAINAVISLSTGVFNGVLSLVFALYCLAKKEVLARQGRRLLYSAFPEKFSDETIRVFRMTNTAFSNFISGQCLEAMILGMMFAIAMPIFQMPYMPLVSVIIAVTALVPIVGAFVGCALGAFFILVDNPEQAFWFVIMFLVLQQIEGNMIYPRVVGSSIGLPGMWVLVAVGVGGDLMGVSGMLIMIPLASVVYALLREFTQRRLAVRKIDPDKLRDHPPVLRSGFKQKQIDKREKKRKARKAKQQEEAKNSES